MTRDELEFSISQYLDGTLPAAERDALDTRLGSDAEARALHAEYESLQGVLAAAPLPAVRWDRFAERVSAAVAREALPAQSYKLNRWLRPAGLAVAASALVAGGVAFSLFRPGNPVASPVELIRIVKIDPLLRDAPTPPPGGAEPVNLEPLRVAIGPPPATDDRPARLYADNVVSRRSKVVIVGAAPLVQDSTVTPF